MTETISKASSAIPKSLPTQEENKSTPKGFGKDENVLAKMTGQDVKEAEKKKNQRNINELDNDAFMKLFLEQLKNQDPTAPMETDKIITQTAQLTQVEMMEQNKKTMMEVAEAMKSTKEVNEELKKFQESFKESLEGLNQGMGESAKASDSVSQMSSFNTVAMIGKIVETDIFGITLDQEGSKLNFSIYFDEAIDTSKGEPNVKIFDADQNLVATLDLKDKNGQKGYINLSWDGKKQDGSDAPKGTYTIKAEYNKDENGKYHEARIGRGEVQSVIFQEGKPMLRLGELIAPIGSALEFYEKALR